MVSKICKTIFFGPRQIRKEPERKKADKETEHEPSLNRPQTLNVGLVNLNPKTP